VSNQYLVSTLISAIRDTGMLPPVDESTSVSRLTGFMNREQRVYLAHKLLKAREEYQVLAVDVAVTAGQTRVPIPTRAIGATMRLVELLDGQGHPVRLYKVRREQVYGANIGGVGDFYLQGNFIVFISSLAAGTVRITYARRMNKLVPEEQAGEVLSFSAGAKTVTLNGSVAPDLFLASATIYDFVQGRPHFDTLASDMTATRSGQVLTFTTALPSDLAIGDFVALAGETPICQAPLEFHDLLVQRGVYKWLKAAGSPKAVGAKEDLKDMEAELISIVCPRVSGDDDVLVNYDGPGWNRATGVRRRRIR
jgi:hypothetical protein